MGEGMFGHAANRDRKKIAQNKQLIGKADEQRAALGAQQTVMEHQLAMLRFIAESLHRIEGYLAPKAQPPE